MLVKTARNLPKLRGRLRDVSVTDAGFIFQNELFDFFFECSGFLIIKTYFVLPLSWPNQRPVERFRGEVRCEKGDGVKAERSCGIDRFTQVTVIRFLNGSAAGYRNAWAVMTDSCNAFVDEIEGSANAADDIVDILWPIEGDNDVVEEGGNFFSTLMQEQAGGQEGEMNILLAKEVAESCEIVV